MARLRVAIAGAGVGGLTAALALAQGGHQVTLFERRTGFAESGAGIQLSPNASRILIDLGLGPALRRVASEPDRMSVRDLASGRLIGGLHLGDFANERYGAPYWFVGRPDLHTTLLDAVRSHPSVRLKFGRTFASAKVGPKSVESFWDGESGSFETMEADLLIGADGLWSRIRTFLGDQRSPIASGFVAYRATIPREVVPAAFRSNEGGLWLGPGRHLVHYPIGRARLVNVVAVERGPERLSSWSSAVEAGRVVASFAGATPVLQDLVGSASDWSAWSLYDLPVKAMTGTRVALIGDAAHPSLPFLAQGGALAIEDAACLASAIDQSPADLWAALDDFAAQRRGRAGRVQGGARRNARAYHAGGLVAAIRNAVMRGLGPDGMTARYDWIYERRETRPA